MRKMKEINIKIENRDEIELLCGKRDENLKFIEKEMGVTFVLRDNFLKIKGTKEQVERAEKLIKRIFFQLRKGYTFSPREIKISLG